MDERKFIKYKDDYLVSDKGEVWRITKKGLREIKPHATKEGYLKMNINRKPKLVHRIVMEAFKGKSELTVDHLNMNKRDNRLCNLEYVTRGENTLRAINNIGNTGAEAQKKKVLYKGTVFKSAQDLSLHLGFSPSYVSQNIRRKKEINGEIPKYI